MTEQLSLTEQLGLALLVGGVRAIRLTNQRRKLELQREGEWANINRHAGQLLRALGQWPVVADQQCEDSACILPPHTHAEPHVNSLGAAFAR